MSEQEKVKINFSWFYPWVAGFLFTLGYLQPELPETFWATVWELLGIFFAWPLLLGAYLGGHA